MHRTHLQITRHIRHHIPNWRQKTNKYHRWKWARLRLCAQFFLKLSTPTYFSLPLRTSLAFFPISFYSLMEYSTHNTHFLSCTRRRPTFEFCVWFSSIYNSSVYSKNVWKKKQHNQCANSINRVYPKTQICIQLTFWMEKISEISTIRCFLSLLRKNSYIFKATKNLPDLFCVNQVHRWTN
jgi:hypothetical protein